MDRLDYIADPLAIERESFRLIDELLELDAYDAGQQAVIRRVVHSTGMPEIVNDMRFSQQACEATLQAIDRKAEILCDVEMVRQGVTKRFLTAEPRCFLNHEETCKRAREHGESRSMAALHLWQPLLADSIVLIGNAPTALFRLLEMLQQSDTRPAVIIALPVGFVGAAESKQALWDMHAELGVECITLLGRLGGSAATVAVLNALLRCHQPDTPGSA